MVALWISFWRAKFFHPNFSTQIAQRDREREIRECMCSSLSSTTRLLLSIDPAFKVFKISGLSWFCVVLCMHNTPWSKAPIANNVQVQLTLYFTGCGRLPHSAHCSGKLPSRRVQVCESNTFSNSNSNSNNNNNNNNNNNELSKYFYINI